MNIFKDVLFVRDKRTKLLALISMIYNYTWSIVKICLTFVLSPFFFISGISSGLIAVIKTLFLKHVDDSESNDVLISFIIGIMLVVIGVLYIAYMIRLFYIDDDNNYSKIVAIAIAAFSFCELGFAIYNYGRALKDFDLIHFSYRSCNLCISGFSLVLTQNAILVATGTPNKMADLGFGIIVGCIAMLIGVSVIVKSKKYDVGYKGLGE